MSLISRRATTMQPSWLRIGAQTVHACVPSWRGSFRGAESQKGSEIYADNLRDEYHPKIRARRHVHLTTIVGLLILM